jgi:L-ascorbate metabolism protein UlaG (beta-lactamase superfamily)
MHITKIGHSCLVVETSGHKILLDPGAYSEGQNLLSDVDIILITHEHQDHLYLPSLQAVMENNPGARIFSNPDVAVILQEKGFTCEVVGDKERIYVNKVALEGVGQVHAPIHPVVPQVSNLGFIIDDRFFYPGDALTFPDKRVEVLALPVAGPWLKISEAVEYALKVSPKACFPVHDGMLKFFSGSHDVPALFLPRHGIKFFRMTEEPSLKI